MRDFAVRYHEEHNSWDPKAEWAATTYNLSIDDHIQTMGVLAKYIDSAMSKPWATFTKLSLRGFQAFVL